MLKWTVMNKRENSLVSNPSNECITSTIPSESICSSKTKRRRPCIFSRQNNSRRRFNATDIRNSISLKQDKENQFTSTPIRTVDDHSDLDVLKDVSNLTPNEGHVLVKTECCGDNYKYKKKRKKPCVDPSYGHEFLNLYPHFLGTFGSDDSLSLVINNGACGCTRDETQYQKLDKKDLPRASNTPNTRTSRKTCSNFEEQCPPSKRAKLDHVNDFLQHLTCITSPESDDGLIFPKLSELSCENRIKITPLVNKFVDLRFSTISYEKNEEVENSTYVNDLSMNVLGDEIFENRDTSTLNEQICNKTLKHAYEEDFLGTSFDKNSFDSGFKSSSTENSHRLDSNYTCRCRNKVASGDCEEMTQLPVEITQIALNDLSNEMRLEDVMQRLSSSQTELDSNFTLKRQKCVRRRKPAETEERKFIKSTPGGSKNVSSNIYSNTSSKIYESTPVEDDHGSCSSSTTPHEVVSDTWRARRCLIFKNSTPEKVSSISGSSSPVDVRKAFKGSLDLSTSYEAGKLTVNVIRCKDLKNAIEGQINAYVKVILPEHSQDHRRLNGGWLQRTPVHANSSNPNFFHTFKIPIRKTDLQKNLILEVWNRNRNTRRSAFLGCMSFAVKHATRKNIRGSFCLLPQSTGRCQSLPITATSLTKLTMCESQSSVEEVNSFEELDNDLNKSTNKVVLSQQQKEADENLFLRYLELDPTEGPDAIPAATQRKATGNKNGRTPFTTTKKLTRSTKSGFGFSVIWTHPPRIERVEKGLPADNAGILPGDYVIFIDKHNVVMMQEIDILNLIRSFGNQLTLEIFRRNVSRNGSVPSVRRINSTGTENPTTVHASTNLLQQRPSTVCSTNTVSVDYNRQKLHLPQVTFSSERPNIPEEARKKAIYQLISKEKQYATAMQFAISRFVAALTERKDLITPTEHRILFQNCEEILQITEDILDALMTGDGEVQTHAVASTYKSKLREIMVSYKRYCCGIKKADCILANKTMNSNSDFVRFLQIPAIPRRRPDITVFIHKPLEHYREVLKLLSVILGHTKFNHEDYPVINQIVHDLQANYREITTEAGLMEPTGTGRPLLSVQDLESRLVFTKCKPFVLSRPGRQWIFGGDLGRVEGRNVRQYWSLLFNDILLFTKVSRDRVLFVTEEPLPLSNISEMCFNVRKKATEFRVTVQQGELSASSPTVHCGPDLTRTPKKNSSRRTIVVRAPTLELKAVWQNLLQRQIFHINSGMEGSSLSSPLESPDVPITSSVATLQSAESLSFRRQTPQYVNVPANPDSQRQIDELIEHKCKQLSKSSSGTKGGAFHLEQWMKGQLGADHNELPEMEPEPEVWSMEEFHKRSKELHIFDARESFKDTERRSESRCEESVFSDHEQSPSKSTTSESQVTVRTSPVVPETVPVCRECHKRCLSYSNCINNMNKTNDNAEVNDNEEEQWQLLASASSNNTDIDPFVSSTPQISVIPATPENSIKTLSNRESSTVQCICGTKRQINHFELNHDFEQTPDDSPLNEDHPYRSLNSSNQTLRRFGTVSSLERLGTDNLDEYEEIRNSSDSEEDDFELEKGIDNAAFGQTALKNWTSRAGSFVVEKISFFERYLKASDNHINGEEIQEDETSGATSGEEIWGTPTSGEEIEDTLSISNHDGQFSPNDGSLSSENDETTELMMDELLMTPPVSSSVMRGLLPRRTLEPLMEEEYSDTCSSSSTETETSASPEQGNEIGDVADTCSLAAEKEIGMINTNLLDSSTIDEESIVGISKIHRSDSYRHIIEAEDDQICATLINHFKPTVQFVNIERVQTRKSTKIFQFFNVKRERRIYETFPERKHLVKLFSKEDTDDIFTPYSPKPISPQKLKNKQLDRRFWKQLNKRRSVKSSVVPP